jgi:hypothetical protein
MIGGFPSMSKNAKAWGWFAGLLFFLFVATSISFAQLPTATILGTVKDASGAVVPGASVTARNIDTGSTRTVPTEGDGSYRLSAMPIGHYEIRAEHEGFEAEVRSGLELTVGLEAVVNMTLQVGSATQTVSVTGEAPLINTTSGSLGGLVDEQKIADLPLNGRNYVDLMMLQTGISQETNKTTTGGQVGTWFSSNGAPVRSNNFLLDGASLANMFGASSGSATGSTLGLDGIQEWRTVTNSFSAEYGMTMGSQMLIASKGGTNVFHGTAFDYLRNSVLDAANFFDKPTVANGEKRLPPYKRNDFGASFGGPIRKDKTFFYAVYEGLRERKGVTTVETVPSAACHNVLLQGDGTYRMDSSADATACGGATLTTSSVIPAAIKPFLDAIPLPTPNVVLSGGNYTYPFTQPTTENYGQIRVDENFSASDSFFTRYTIDDAQELFTANYVPFSTLQANRNQYLTLSENHVFSPTLLNTLRFSISRTNLPQTDPPSGLTGPNYSMIPGLEMGSIAITGGLSNAFTTFSLAPQFVKQNIFTTSDDVFKTMGKHALKFGILWNHYQNEVLRETGAKGSVSFGNTSSFMQGIPASWSTGLTPPPASVLGRSYHYNTIGLYAQDDWRVRPTLTLNLGLRYEFSTTYNEENGHGAAFRNVATDITGTPGPPFQNPSLHNFSPRVGFAWDVFGNGKTSVKAGFGLLYDIATLGFSLFQTNLTPPWGSSSSHSNGVTILGCPTANSPLALPLVFCPADLGTTLNGIQYNLQQPQMLQYNLAVERQLPGNFALTVAYGGSRGTHIMETLEGNPTVPVIVNGQPVWNPYICSGAVSAVSPSGAGCTANPNFLRVNGSVPGNKGWQSYQMTGSMGDSWYNSLQLNVTRRMTRGLSIQGAYTYSKSLDDGQGQAGGETNAANIYPAYSQNLRQNKGPSVFDNMNNFRLNVIYQFADFRNKQGVLGSALSGWGVRAILADQSAYPFTPTLGADRSNDGASGSVSTTGSIDTPSWASGRNPYNATHGVSTSNGVNACPTAGKPLGTPSLFYDPCAFVLQTPGTLGNVTRDVMRMSAFHDFDFSITKDTPLKFREGAALQFRAEFFNLLNHPNFAVPNRTVYQGSVTGTTADVAGTEAPSGTAGQILLTNNNSRQVQIALRLVF